jgi:LPXTG-motif cell wall-anchored protein
MKKPFLVLFLSVSLACLSQVTVSGGYATTTPQTAMQPGVPGPPQIVPSDIALPGSGPPVGAPLTNSNTNDARTGGMVHAYNPVAVVEQPVVENTTETGAGLTSGAQLPFNTGLQSFAGSAKVGQGSGFSLGEFARQYRNQAHQPTRTFTNDSIAQLSGGQALPQGREMAQAVPRDAQREMAMAAAIPPMSASGVSQNDAAANASAQPNQIDQRKRTSSEAANQTATANSNADAVQADQNAENSDRNNLPASGSELPLLALLGIAIAGGGALYRFRR